jgi:hypothetical protein
MTLISAKKGYEIWAKWDKEAQVYELFFDHECETFTGWAVDSLKDAKKASEYIIAEHTIN